METAGDTFSEIDPGSQTRRVRAMLGSMATGAS